MVVRLPRVVVEEHDGVDHARGHHEHDAVEVSSCGKFPITSCIIVYHDIIQIMKEKRKNF